MTEKAGALIARRDQAFYSNQNLLQTQKEGDDTLRYMNNQGMLTYYLLIMLFLYISQSLFLKMMP